MQKINSIPKAGAFSENLSATFITQRDSFWGYINQELCKKQQDGLEFKNAFSEPTLRGKRLNKMFQTLNTSNIVITT